MSSSRPAERLFVDTSVIVALLAGEDEADSFAARLEAASTRWTSPLVILEATMRLSTLLDINPIDAEQGVRALLATADIAVADMGDRTAALAVRAFERYGKGRGHPARLNLADCFSYACAAELGLALLYKGEDFARTDLA